MDGAPPLSSQIAEAKAAGAATWRKDGGQLEAMKDCNPAFLESVGRLTRLPLLPVVGSALIRDGDAVLGAVGVSSASGEEDLGCAEAGLRAVLCKRGRVLHSDSRIETASGAAGVWSEERRS